MIIQQQGYYELNETKIDIAELQRLSEQNRLLITPDQGLRLSRELRAPETGPLAAYKVTNQSTVQAILDLSREGKHPAVLNFASATIPIAPA